MLDANQRAIECTASNFFAVKDNRLFTPALKQSGIHGIMREQVIDIASRCNNNVSECNITMTELSDLDEIFITNSLIGLKSVNKLNDITFDSTQVAKSIFEELLGSIEKHVQTI